MLDCRGLTADEISTLICEALPQGGEGVFADVCDHIAEVEDSGGCHGFWGWVSRLGDGQGYLPEVIPLPVLIAWRDGFIDDAYNVYWRGRDPRTAGHSGVLPSPLPIVRCASCLMILPSCGRWADCPVCGSSRLESEQVDGGWREIPPEVLAMDRAGRSRG